LVFVADSLNLRQLQSAYKELDGESHQHQDCEDNEAKFAATVKSIAENFPAGCAMLDIGTGSGEFARLLRHEDHNYVSVHEIPSTNLEHLKEYGIRVYQDFDYRSIPDNSFDIVTLFDVAEHALDYLATDSVADQLMIAHVYNVDVRGLLPRVSVPILVVHCRNNRATRPIFRRGPESHSCG
jgi:2-polyprenyl-3-methyl-5-hydroxy-6-metoxy-1,4-benzoquinol methylase